MDTRGARTGRILIVMTSVLCVVSACKKEWTPSPTIGENSGATLGPQSPTVLAGGVMYFSFARADKDTCYTIGLNGNVNYDNPTLVDDEMSPSMPEWHVTAGCIDPPTSGVTLVKWYAPDEAQSVLISVKDDDLPTPLAEGDVGGRDDAPEDMAGSTVATVVLPEVVAVRWDGYPMYDVDPEKSVWDDSSVELHTPQYDNTGGNLVRSPVCVRKGTSPSITARTRTPSPLTYDTRIMLMAEEGDEASPSFCEGEVTIPSGGVEDYGSCHSALAPLPDIVDVRWTAQSWRYKVPDGTDAWIEINFTDAELFVTYGVPSGSDPTTKRVWWVCTKAKGQSQEPNCVDEVFWGVKNDARFGLGVWPPSPPWLTLGGTSGECWTLRDLHILGCRMLGLTCGIESGYIYPELNHGNHHQNNGDMAGRWDTIPRAMRTRYITSPPHGSGVIHNEYCSFEELWYIADCGSNRYEAAARYAGLYYCQPVAIFRSPSHAMVGIVQKTVWMWWTDSQGSVNTCDYPYPEHDWMDANHPYPLY